MMDEAREPTALQKLWDDLAAVVARARQQDSWHLMLDGHAQDLEQAETTLRATREAAGR